MKKFLVSIMMAVTLAVGVGVLATGTVYADANTDAAKQQVCAGISNQVGGNCDTGSGSSISGVITVVLQILSIVAGLAAVIMIIIAGLRYITSGGDAQSVAGAKRGIIYAVIGLVVVAFSQFIVRFVLNNVGK